MRLWWLRRTALGLPVVPELNSIRQACFLLSCPVRSNGGNGFKPTGGWSMNDRGNCKSSYPLENIVSLKEKGKSGPYSSFIVSDLHYVGGMLHPFAFLQAIKNPIL
jgi:hypothetical protein